MTARQVGYGDEVMKLYDLQAQGDRIPGAFFRMKAGLRKEGKWRAKGEKAVVLSNGYSGVVILTHRNGWHPSIGGVG